MSGWLKYHRLLIRTSGQKGAVDQMMTSFVKH